MAAPGACALRTSRSALRTLPIACPQRRVLSTSQPVTSSSVNAAEVSHFNALSSSWWDPHGPMRLLHLMNPLRHDFIAACRRQQNTPTSSALPARTLRYLDVGCGGGIFAESAARLPTTLGVTGVDPSAEVLAVARAHAASDPVLREAGRLQYVGAGVEALPVPPRDEDKVDVLAVWEVIEHVDRPDEFLRVCMRHVRPGGWLVLSTIARTWSSWLTTKAVAEDVLRIVPRGTHDWDKYINEHEMRDWFAKEPGWGGISGDGQEGMRAEGCMYVPAVGWKFVPGAESWGNYFFGVRKDVVQ